VVVELDDVEVVDPLRGVVDDELLVVVVLSVPPCEVPDDVLGGGVFPDAQAASTTGTVTSVSTPMQAAGLNRILT
jgi:hypothetical protein